MYVKDVVPTQTVEKHGFKAMAKALHSQSAVPSRKHFTQNKIPNLYSSCREKEEQMAHTLTHSVSCAV